MFLLVIFAFIAGLVTILSPCILPVLPIVLSGTVGSGKQKPFGIIVGFVASFTFFTLFLTTIVKATGISPDLLRLASVVIIATFGLSLVIPKIQIWTEILILRLTRLLPKPSQGNSNSHPDLVNGFLIGLSLGLIWTPCVGPILASVISLALSGAVTTTSTLITLSYAIGTAIPMLAIMYGGRRLLNRVPWLITNTAKIQKVFGVLMIITAIGIATNIDRKFQTWILEKFPAYGSGLTQFEDNDLVKTQLTSLRVTPMPNAKKGQPLFEMTGVIYPPAPQLISGGQWFNSDPFTISHLKGKVILVDFWTYTCINCIRTLPYLKKWHTTYKDKGLIIIGVHTPEFEFEKNPDNLKKAIADFDLAYPVMQDNDYATWRAYNNHYWPAKYLADKDGRIRYTHFGEGKYDETEAMIQKLLSETGVEITDKPDNPNYQINARTPELYLGFNRLNNIYTFETPRLGQKINYSLAAQALPLHYFGLIGDWTVGDEWAEPDSGSSLQLQFEAQEVFLVMRPKITGSSNRVTIRLNGQTVAPDTSNAGEDVTADDEIIVNEDRLYKLIKLPTPGKNHLYLEFPDSNIELYAFTFG